MEKCSICNIKKHSWCWLQSIDHCDWINQDHWKSHNLARSELGKNIKVEPPSLLKQTIQAAQAAVNFVVAGLPLVSDEEKARRLSICAACQHYDAEANRCRVCGCFLGVKVTMATEECPLRKWVAVAINKGPTGTCGGCGSANAP